MKKILLLILFAFLLTGCSNIEKMNVEDVISEVQTSKLKLNNQYRTGYKYYLPTDLNLKETLNLNEIILSKDYKYYLYVDLISYYNKVEFTYEISPNSYISKDISYKDIIGYLEVNVKDDKYLIEIMYNYAKIELIVDEDYLKEAIVNSLVILSTIKYNDDIINNMMGENILSFGEEQLNIFETNKSESNFLEYLQDYDAYEGDDVPDLDLIN